MFEEFTRPTNIIATSATWAANDIVLANGEIGIEVLPSNAVRLKAGDGVLAWSALDYIEIADVTINTATQTALDLKLALAGGTLTGPLVLAGDPSTDLGAATKQYVDAINSSLTTTLASKLDSSGGNLTGYLTLNADPTTNLHAATKSYVDTEVNKAVLKSGDTMTGAFVLAADPVNPLEAATKQYVDSGSYQTVVGGSSSYAGKVVKLNSFGFLDTSVVPIFSIYVGTINITAAYALTATYTVGSYFAVTTTGTIDASWNTKINGAPSTCGAGQFLIYSVNGKWDLVGDSTSSTAIAAKLDKAGGTMTGFITLHADPTNALHAATKQYADTMLPKAGGTMTGLLTLSGAPTSNLHAATKLYVDTADALAALKANNLSDLASASTARTNLGATATGGALFTAASASAARSTLGSTATGDALFTAASAAAGRSTLGAAASGSNTDITAISLDNTGLLVKDTDASHTLSIVPSSNLTANRTLSIATGDASRTLTISANATVSQDYSTSGSPQFTDLTLTGVGAFSAGSASAPSLIPAGDTNTGMWFPAADTIAWSTSGSERMRVDSSGRLLVGASTAYAAPNFGGGVQTAVSQIHGVTSSASSQSLTNWSSSATNSVVFLIAKSVGGAVGTRGALTAAGTELGAITFSGDDGTNFIPGAAIRVQVDAAPTTGDMPSRLSFLTTAAGAVTSTERMRINRLGNVGIGTTAPDALLSVNGIASFGDGAAATPSIANFGDLNTGMWFPDADTIAFSTGGSERLRIDSGGNIGIGTSSFGTSAATVLAIATGTAPTTGPADTIQIFSTDLSAGNTILSLRTEGTPVNANTTAAATHRIAIRVNGTVYYLLANTAA